MYSKNRFSALTRLLLVISLGAFVLVRLPPGSPFDRERKPASPEVERAVRAKFHLDEPIWKQYLRYLGLLWERGADGHWQHAAPSFDISLRYRNHNVSDIVAQGLPISMALGALAFCFAMGTGIPLGCITA